MKRKLILILILGIFLVGGVFADGDGYYYHLHHETEFIMTDIFECYMTVEHIGGDVNYYPTMDDTSCPGECSAYVCNPDPLCDSQTESGCICEAGLPLFDYEAYPRYYIEELSVVHCTDGDNGICMKHDNEQESAECCTPEDPSYDARVIYGIGDYVDDPFCCRYRDQIVARYEGDEYALGLGDISSTHPDYGKPWCWYCPAGMEVVICEGDECPGGYGCHDESGGSTGFLQSFFGKITGNALGVTPCEPKGFYCKWKDDCEDGERRCINDVGQCVPEEDYSCCPNERVCSDGSCINFGCCDDEIECAPEGGWPIWDPPETICIGENELCPDGYEPIGGEPIPEPEPI